MRKSNSKSKRNETFDRTKRVAICGMLTALGVVILYIGSLAEVLDISMAAISSLICILAIIEYGGAYPWLIYSATSIVALFILPQKFAPALYAVFLGYYPMVKQYIERIGQKNPNRSSKVIQWVLKIVLFNLSLLIFVLISFYLLAMPNEEMWIKVALFILGNFAFVVYDLALTRIISMYIFKFRSRIKLPGRRNK